jgi:hypothetical protein
MRTPTWLCFLSAFSMWGAGIALIPGVFSTLAALAILVSMAYAMVLEISGGTPFIAPDPYQIPKGDYVGPMGMGEPPSWEKAAMYVVMCVVVMACGGDENIARNIQEQRAGMDGVDGTYDDAPARGPQDIARLQGVPVMPNQGTPLAVFSTVSSTFEIRVDARLGALSRRYIAVLRRTSLRDMPVLTFRRE